MSSIFMNVRLWLILAACGVVYAGIHFYVKSQALQEQLIIQKATHAQNTAALQDSLHKRADSIQTMAVRISNLNAGTSKLQDENRILVTKYELFIDSVLVSDTAAIASEKDSIGEYLKVSFEGKKSIVTYKGYTKAYLTPLSKATYVLDLDFDVIRTSSEFLRNDSSGLFYIKTTSLTTGVNLIGYTTLDSAAFPYLYGMKRDPVVVGAGVIFVGGAASRDVVQIGIGIKPSNWFFTINYKVFERLLVETQSFLDRIQLGVYYRLF